MNHTKSANLGYDEAGLFHVHFLTRFKLVVVVVVLVSNRRTVLNSATSVPTSYTADIAASSFIV